MIITGGEVGLAGQAGKHVWQQDVDGACTLQHHLHYLRMIACVAEGCR